MNERGMPGRKTDVDSRRGLSAARTPRAERLSTVRFRFIGHLIGLILCALAGLMLIPVLVDLAFHNEDWKVFLASAAFTLFVGGLLVASTSGSTAEGIGRKEGFAFTTLCWVVVAAFSALPFIGVGLPYTDAFFESMSGLTTTGSTVLTRLEELPRGILIWRSLLQGLGGIGIVVTAIIVLPFLRVGGMQLFHTESSDRSEKVVPRAGQLVAASASIYAALILACALVYLALGMSLFDAVCHALTTVSTGGFSTYDASIGHFDSGAIEIACMVFMLAGALPFVVLIRAAKGDVPALWQDAQVRGLVMFVAGASLALAVWHMELTGSDFFASLLTTSFNVVSVVTTTGFANEDYLVWGPFAVFLFFLLTFVGGCAGSTSGGIKTYRFQVAFMLLRAHFLQLMSPNRVVSKRYNGKHLSEDVPFSVIAFLAAYMGMVGFVGLVLSAMGLDFMTAMSASATAIGNVGPGIGGTVGPAGNFATLPDAAKWTLSFAMLLGRLELFTVLVLFNPEFWRR